ncbi:MAG: magnesium/cobalt transporter CorA [Bacteroidia bacterium]|jgi:magnesium transporter
MSELILYNEESYTRAEHSSCDHLQSKLAGHIAWLNLEGTDTPHFAEIQEFLHLHPLLVEDLNSSNQLPKFEVFGDLAFLSLQMFRRGKTGFVTEHLSLLVKDNLLISIQDHVAGDTFDSVRQRLENNYKRLAKNGIDYLFLLLVDAQVDEFMAVTDGYRKPIEDLEQAMAKKPAVSVMKRIMEHKSELNTMRRYMVPLKEEMQRIRIEHPEFLKKSNQALYRDIMDHLNTLISNFENLREMLRDLADLNHSNQNLVLNNTMKTLTGISAIFIPLTFIVGVYGMNFKHFPELEWANGYYYIWVVMLAIAGGMVWFMKKRKWF